MRRSPLGLIIITATFRCDAPARWGAVVDERRIVAGDAGALVRTAPAHCGAFADQRRVVAGDADGRVRTLIQSPWL